MKVDHLIRKIDYLAEKVGIIEKRESFNNKNQLEIEYLLAVVKSKIETLNNLKHYNLPINLQSTILIAFIIYLLNTPDHVERLPLLFGMTTLVFLFAGMAIFDARKINRSNRELILLKELLKLYKEYID